jgi:predicted ATP-dependent endonuclease of OLD family
MRIKSIRIQNFRSIKDLTIPLETYGSGIMESSTTFLVGMNESGKSAILEAISLLSVGMEDINYEDYCFLAAQEDKSSIYVSANIEIDDSSFLREQIIKKLNLPEKFVKDLEITSLTKYICRTSEMALGFYILYLKENLPFYKYVICKNGSKKVIDILSTTNNIEEEINKENAKSFLLENQELLTKINLEQFIASELKSVFDDNLPKIQIWKSSPEFLINETIDLNEFKENTNISIPLKNIFHIYGKTTDEDIKAAIDRALGNQARTDELQAKMTDKVTKHINRIWKEHKIKIRISINAGNCEVHIEDKDTKYAYFSMNQRSDGFKQFVSLILSLSAQNESNKLKDMILLIDEPEVHLHPSGVRYMRDEILKIGKNNSIIVSTHSHYMVDTETPERHWIVQKEKSETKLSQISKDAQIEDDSVLTSAFGLNLFKELLPSNILIVEGDDDKNILSHSINILKSRNSCSLKAAGGASKAPGFARILSDENINASILFDADKEGVDNMKKILHEQNETYSEQNVYTLKSIIPSLPDKSTIEDVLPISFVKIFFDREMECEFNLVDNIAIIDQLKRQNEVLRSNKYKLDALKLKLSKEFCAEYTTKTKLKESVRLIELIDSVLLKIESYRQN